MIVLILFIITGVSSSQEWWTSSYQDDKIQSMTYFPVLIYYHLKLKFHSRDLLAYQNEPHRAFSFPYNLEKELSVRPLKTLDATTPKKSRPVACISSQFTYSNGEITPKKTWYGLFKMRTRPVVRNSLCACTRCDTLANAIKASCPFCDGLRD